MFSRCDFLMGKDDSIVVVIPAHLPKAETYTVSVCSDRIRFKAGHNQITEFPYDNNEVFRRIANNVQVGLVEYQSGEEFPRQITNVAYVEVRSAH